MTSHTQLVAVITGGSSGLGLAMSVQLAHEGYTPVILARNKARLDEAVTQLRQVDEQAQGFVCDVTSQADLDQTRQVIQTQFPKIDFLILNAGVVHVELLEDAQDMAALKADIEIDLWGTIQTARAFESLLSSGARVLCISSGFGLVGVAGYTAYCAAKAGVITFAEAWRRELLRRGISVYVACPSDIDTPQFHQEQTSLPAWLKIADTRGTSMAPEAAAAKILRRCTGGRFLIIINSEIKLLLFLSRFLPRCWMDRLLDRLFPKPS